MIYGEKPQHFEIIIYEYFLMKMSDYPACLLVPPVKSAFNMHFVFLISAPLVVVRNLYRHHLCPEVPST